LNTNFAKQNVNIHNAIGILLLFLYVESSLAGEVRFTPYVGVTEYYSDNILLAPKGQEQGDFVTELSPAFDLQMIGNRFNANVNYQLQHLLYQKESNRNQTFNQLTATTSTELTADYLYLDVNANHTQQIVDANQTVSNNNIALTDNRTNVSSISLSPSFRHSFDKLDANVRYTYSKLDYRRDELINSEQSGSNIRLNSPTRAIGVTWALNYTQQKNDYETGSDSEYKQGSIELGYRFSPRSSVYASRGKEENTFSVSNNQDIDDYFWSLGLNWQPSSRDSVSLSFGERYFGKTQSFNWRHNARRLVLTVNYDEELSNSASALLESQQAENSQPVDNNGSITTQTFVREAGSLGISYNFSKTSVSLNYLNERRKYQDTGAFEKIQNANLRLSLRSSEVLTYILAGGWNSNYFSNLNTKRATTNIELSLERRLSSSMQAEFSIFHNLSRARNSSTDYDENLISLGITKTFN